MPAQAAPVADERSALLAYLAQQQDAFRCAVFGLTDDQAGTRSTVSELTVGTLVKHVTGVQRSWLDIVLAAPGTVEASPDAYEDHARGFVWESADTVASVLAAYDDVCDRVLAAVESVDLATAVPIPDEPWNPKDVDAWSVRWVWFHLIEELARHAGHADIVREALDGATMYELLAGREGWPETPWLKPRRPA